MPWRYVGIRSTTCGRAIRRTTHPRTRIIIPTDGPIVDLPPRKARGFKLGLCFAIHQPREVAEASPKRPRRTARHQDAGDGVPGRYRGGRCRSAVARRPPYFCFQWSVGLLRDADLLGRLGHGLAPRQLQLGLTQLEIDPIRLRASHGASIAIPGFRPSRIPVPEMDPFEGGRSVNVAVGHDNQIADDMSDEQWLLSERESHGHPMVRRRHCGSNASVTGSSPMRLTLVALDGAEGPPTASMSSVAAPRLVASDVTKVWLARPSSGGAIILEASAARTA